MITATREPKRCEVCGRVFIPTSGRQKYCELHSEKIQRRKNAAPMRPCARCRREFIPTHPQQKLCDLCRPTEKQKRGRPKV